jgi:hypothetical protein
MMLLLIIAQTAAQAPDIELSATVRARSVTIEKQGRADLTVTAEPEGANVVEVKAPKANGRRTLRNVAVTVDAAARIGDPSQAHNNREQPETASPQ